MLIRLFLLLAAAGVEAVPLALIAGAVAVWSVSRFAGGPSPLPILAAVVLAYVLTRLLLRRRLQQRPARLVLALAAVVVTPLLLLGASRLGLGGASRQDFGVTMIPALAAGLYGWSRGTVLAREDLDFDAIYTSFRRGLIILFVALLLAVTLGNDAGHRLLAAGWGQVIVFFLAGLCALSLARVEEERRRGAGAEGPPPIRGEWVGTLLGATGAVGLIGLVLASFMSPAAATLALAPFGRLLDLLEWLLTPVFLVLASLVDPLVRWLRPLFQRKKQTVQTPKPGKHPPPSLTLTHLTSHQILALGRTALVILLLIVACVALWRAFSLRQRSAVDADTAEERESLWSWALLGVGVRSALRRLLARLFGRRRAAGASKPVVAEAAALLSIREIYRRLLVRAAALGLARRRDETPHEYLGRLRSAVPASEKDAALLTGLYAHARYGPEPPGPRDVAAAGEVWARLEPVLRREDSTPSGTGQ